MKELTKVNDYYEGKTKLYSDVDKTLDYLFPELKESDDERIRKELIWGFKHLPEETFAGISINDIISWLEKQYKKDEEIILLKDKIESLESARIAMQECHRLELEKLEKQDEQKYMKTCAEYYNQDNELKMPELSEFENKLADILMYREYDGPDETEDDIAKGRLEYELAAIRLSEELLPLAQKEQKPVDKVEPKFKVGDFIVNDYCFGKVIELTDDAYLLDTGQGIPFSCEHNAHLWTIQDAKDGDVLASKKEVILFKSYNDNNFCYYCWYNGQTDNFHPKDSHTSKPNLGIITPASKEQRDLLFQKMKEAGYEWDAEKKELKKIEQNPAWSEEDEYHKRQILRILKDNGCSKTLQEKTEKWIEERLKSLRPQNTWKPSDTEINILQGVIDGSFKLENVKVTLTNILEQLKKLREE